jgi:hypothetical protein
MDVSREALLAAANNADWYDAVFRSLGLSWTIEDGVWTSREVAPAYHSNALLLAPAVAAHREIVRRLAVDLRRPFSFKDGFAAHDFTADGFRPLFDAEWIWRNADTPLAAADSRVGWHRAATPAQLEAWEAALRANGSPAETRVFLPRLLEDPSIAFFAAYDHRGIVAGCAANRSEEVVGFSNFFADECEGLSRLAGAVAAASRFAPGLAIVGYDRGERLNEMRRIGFRSVQQLRVWHTAAR